MTGKVILETNERTKDKTTEYIKNIDIDKDFTIGELLESHKQLIEVVNKQSKQINTLYQQINIIINAIKSHNVAVDVNIANIIESIKELGGNI